METQQEVCLSVDQKEFKAKKDLLIEYSDYFRAMFSGNFIEKEQQEIRIDVVDWRSMEIILKYMQLGFIDLSDYCLSTVGDLFSAAIFLQITELIKQIDYCLEEKLSISNWLKITEIARKAPSPKLEQVAVTYGLMSFKYMKPEYILTEPILFWYLSHPYLYTESELQVFTFGVEWCELNEVTAEGLLIILCCLDYSKLKYSELKEMNTKTMMKDQDFIDEIESSPAEVVIKGLFNLSEKFDLSIKNIGEHKELIFKDNKHMDREHYNLLFNIICDSIQRKLNLTPVVPMWPNEGCAQRKPEVVQNFLYTYSHETGLNQWIEIGQKNHWGWSLTTWNPTKIVMCGGEFGRGTGMFMRDVRVFDIHKKEWIHHGVELPCVRHAGVVVLGDELYILGGVGAYRIVLDTAIIYNLKQRTFRRIASLPDAIQSPAVCVHENEVYMAGHKHIYKYAGTGINDRWEKVLETQISPNFLVSLNGYIFVAQNYFEGLFRFQPGVDSELIEVAKFQFPPISLYGIGSNLLGFTYKLGVDGMECEDNDDSLTVEEYPIATESQPSRKTCWNLDKCGVHMTGSCLVLMDPPPINTGISEFHQEIIKGNLLRDVSEFLFNRAMRKINQKLSN